MKRYVITVTTPQDGRTVEGSALTYEDAVRIADNCAGELIAYRYAVVNVIMHHPKEDERKPQIIRVTNLRKEAGTERATVEIWETTEPEPYPQYKQTLRDICGALREHLKQVADIIQEAGACSLSKQERETLTGLDEVIQEADRITRDLSNGGKNAVADACNTDCSAYARGTCRYTVKADCPRVQQIYNEPSGV